MAGIGLYGVFYSKATMEDGQVSGYSGVQTMGKAISATYANAETGSNDLHANNGISESDGAASSGGTLTLTLDRLKAAAIADLFGMTSTTESVTVGGQSVTGTGFNYTGDESANTVGVAFIRQKQEDGNRAIHEAVIFSAVTFAMPDENAQTIGESIEWQTPELTGTVTNNSGDLPWHKAFTFPTQAAAEAFITNYFAASSPEPGGET